MNIKTIETNIALSISGISNPSSIAWTPIKEREYQIRKNSYEKR